MQTIAQITQPQPCHESWTGMTPVENGRFCQSCNKAVVDFTTMTNQQIIDHLAASSGNLCGRISSSQFSELNNQLARPVPNNAGFWKRVMLTVTMLASLSHVKAQTATLKAKTEQTQAPNVIGEIMIAEAPVEYITLTGIVTDAQGKPLHQATVSTGKQSTMTSSDGIFRLRVPENTKAFQVNYIGWEVQTIKVNNKRNKNYKIKMLPSVIYLGGLGAIKRPGTVKTFYQTYLVNPLKLVFG